MKRCRERREIGDSEASCSPPTRHADALVHTAVCLGCMRRILSWSHVHIAARCFRKNAAAEGGDAICKISYSDGSRNKDNAGLGYDGYLQFAKRPGYSDPVERVWSME